MKKLIVLIMLASSCSRNTCEIKVQLENGDIIRGEYIHNYISGVSNIKRCNGGDFQINTSDIKEVIYY